MWKVSVTEIEAPRLRQVLRHTVKESYQKCGADMTSRNLTNAVVAIDYTPNFYTMSPPPPPPLGPLPLTAFV